jgi:uncharacterized OB-fold protein
MYKFITIRCRSCGSVIYNIQEKDFKRPKLVNLTCEDCMDQATLEGVSMKIKDSDNRKTVMVV